MLSGSILKDLEDIFRTISHTPVHYLHNPADALDLDLTRYNSKTNRHTNIIPTSVSFKKNITGVYDPKTPAGKILDKVALHCASLPSSDPLHYIIRDFCKLDMTPKTLTGKQVSPAAQAARILKLKAK